MSRLENYGRNPDPSNASGNGAGLFRIGEEDLDWKEWLGETNDASDWARTKFVDPSRDITSYAQSIGLSDPSLEGFLAATRQQRRGHWDPRLTAAAVNDYIREGLKKIKS